MRALGASLPGSASPDASHGASLHAIHHATPTGDTRGRQPREPAPRKRRRRAAPRMDTDRRTRHNRPAGALRARTRSSVSWLVPPHSASRLPTSLDGSEWEPFTAPHDRALGQGMRGSSDEPLGDGALPHNRRPGFARDIIIMTSTTEKLAHKREPVFPHDDADTHETLAGDPARGDGEGKFFRQLRMPLLQD